MQLLLLVLIPAIAGLICLALPSPRKCLLAMIAGVSLTACHGFFQVTLFFGRGQAASPAPGWIFLDALSAYHLAVLLLVFCLSTAYAWVYFDAELAGGKLSLRQARLFCCLFTEALATMSLTLISNNLGIMWVGIEATTLVTAFLIYLHPSREALEAMWKYILICSVGVAFAFMGTLLFAASAQGLHIPVHETMLFTTLRAHAQQLNPALLKTAFIFILVGYGTKAGLAPMHNWLPDAHSQAPAPVSALFSGFMLNTALYCIMRFLPIVETTLSGSGWALELLQGFGLLSIVVAAAFILFQRDLKRLLAYSSVEHLGIITLGLGLGGWGTFAALFHTLNHSLCKTLAFFAAGRLGHIYGTHDMREMAGTFRVNPVWGTGLFGSLLALIGLAPFAFFMSEFLIARAALDQGAFFSLFVFLLGAGVVFVGALGHAIPLFWGSPAKALPVSRANSLEMILVFAPLIALLVLGVTMPPALKDPLVQAADILRNVNAGSLALLGGVRP